MQQQWQHCSDGAMMRSLNEHGAKRRLQKPLMAALSFLLAMICLCPLPAHAVDMGPVVSAFDNLRWMAYSPTNYNPHVNKQPKDEDVRKDLQLLKDYGFGGIVTYGCSGANADNIPRIAQELGFKIIVGVWNPADYNGEIKNAISLAKNNPAVIAVSVGNEGLEDKYNMWNPEHMHYSLATLKASIDKVRAEGGKPTTSSQQWKSYTEQNFRDLCDFMFPTIHPFWEKVYNAQKGVTFTTDHIDTIKRVSGDKIVVPKEVGYPTCAPCSEEVQRDYYVGLAKQPYKFCYFEAFDGNWKSQNTNATECHWGLFTEHRKPKLAATAIKP